MIRFRPLLVMLALMGLLLLTLLGCHTALPPGATCQQRWDAYADDRMHGAMLGGLLGGSMSGDRPTC